MADEGKLEFVEGVGTCWTPPNATPETTLGWERGRLSGATAWALAETDLLAQQDEDGWSLYLEHEVYGAEFLMGVDTWAEVLDYVNSGAELVSCA